MQSIAEMLKVAIEHHRANRLAQAEQVYRAILEQDPRQVDALNLFGVLSLAQQRHALAIYLFRKAIEVAPDIPVLYRNLGRALEANRDLAEAVVSYRAWQTLDPNAEPRPAYDMPLRHPGRIHAVFIAQYQEFWPSFASIYQAMQSDTRFTCTVVAVQSREVNRGNADFADYISGFLKSREIPALSGDEVDAADLEPDVIFFHRPWDLERPPNYRIQHLSRHARLVYVPYGFEIGGNWEMQQFNGSIHNHAWRVIARSERFRRLFARYCVKGDGHVVALGHPKLDGHFGGSAPTPEQVLGRRLEAGQKVLLWNPHFSATPTNEGWSTFFLFKEAFFEAAARYPEHLFVMRPHPHLRHFVLNQGFMTGADWEAFDRRCEAAGNIVIHTAPDYYALFKLTDGLLSDTSSLLFEFLPTGKPICYLSSASGHGLNEEGEIVQLYYRATAPDRFMKFVEQVVTGSDPLREDRIVGMKEFLGTVDGRIGERIRDYIAGELLELPAA